MSNDRTFRRAVAKNQRALLASDLDQSVKEAVRGLGTILGIWAHPDDEAWLSAGLMAVAVLLGLRVECLTATGGEAGSRDGRWPQESISGTRQRELLASLKTIGIPPSAHSYLGYTDGELYLADDEEVIQRILAQLIRVMPDTVITFGPDGFTGHEDHRRMSDLATKAFLIYVETVAPHAQLLYQASTAQWQSQVRPLLELANAMYGEQYPIVTPEGRLYLNLTLTGLLLELKLEAVMAHTSQITPLMETVGGMEPLLAWFAHEAFVRAILPSSTRRSGPSADIDSDELFAHGG